jgi:pyrimidine operon attenuation protein/uracil phosphoribosyltransferase
MPTITQTQILNDAQVKQILKRIAYQVYETHFNEKELIIAGIEGRGYSVAQMLLELLSDISKIKLSLIEVKLDKRSPSQDEIILSDPKLKLEEKSVLLVDDVLNTGKTMIYALLPFLHAQAKSIHTAVLVDRDHKSFPVNADFIGISLSTTLQEHINVTIVRNKVNVYLS